MKLPPRFGGENSNLLARILLRRDASACTETPLPSAAFRHALASQLIKASQQTKILSSLRMHLCICVQEIRLHARENCKNGILAIMRGMHAARRDLRAAMHIGPGIDHTMFIPPETEMAWPVM